MEHWAVGFLPSVRAHHPSQGSPTQSKCFLGSPTQSKWLSLLMRGQGMGLPPPGTWLSPTLAWMWAGTCMIHPSALGFFFNFGEAQMKGILDLIHSLDHPQGC